MIFQLQGVLKEEIRENPQVWTNETVTKADGLHNLESFMLCF